MNELNVILALLRSAVTGVPAGIAVDGWAELLRTAKRYQILFLVLLGAERSGISVPRQLSGPVSADLSRLLNLDGRQRYLAETILCTFSERAIDHAPLKGLRLKELYPEPAARSMGDVDILVRLEQLAPACGILRELGFQQEKETHHEVVFTCQGVEVELHKCLIPPYNKDYYAYYRDDWSFFHPGQDDSHRYEMSPEEELIYLVTHLAKHYRDGGVGPKHLIDLWLFRRRFEVEEDRVLSGLKKLRLDAFYRNLIATAEHWFADGPETELTAFLTKRIFSNGAWGTGTAITLADSVKSGEKLDHMRVRKARQILFPGVDYLKYAYPVLQKHPAALPVVWVRRWTDRLRRRDRVSAAGKAIKNTTREAVSDYKRELEYVGLGFHFE